ncbi:MAG TPA: 50S ribosomal protein L25 [Methylomirabilota bacterium]|jgi:large subunit ribosomal protein L25
MNIRELSVEPREALGKGAVGRLRRKGLVPAILYGGGGAPVTLSVTPAEVHRTLHGHGAGGVLVNLRLPGDAEPRTAVVRELQYDPVRDTLIHIDFQAVRMDEEITVEVPIHVVGEAAGVKEQSGVLALLMRTVEVSCLPSLIPEHIDVDVSALRIHDVATVAGLQLPEGVRVTAPASQPVATVAPPMAEEVAPVAAAAVAEPEVVTERKPKEEEEAKGKEEPKGREEGKAKK